MLRVTVAVFFILAGINHFWHTPFYVRITPPNFPHLLALVYISGICEIAGGAGLLVPSFRRIAGLGLIVLLIAVFPANIYMAIKPDQFADLLVHAWVLWFRLPLQVVFILAVWRVSKEFHDF